MKDSLFFISLQLFLRNINFLIVKGNKNHFTIKGGLKPDLKL